MDPVTGLSIGRIVIGAAALASPEQAARASGLSPAENPHMDYFTRMFGAREVALGAITLVARGPLRRNLTIVGIAVDAADAVSAGLGLTGQRVPKPASGVLLGAALGAVGAGVVSLARRRRTATA
ncbi:DUF4267 domain-containing protein [Nocardioides sambongensis]|uniref:DUF4267 domain-containing protein n=1 Tax=Nocardioides sambongensis TaxID=2589074 RepID=UPI00112DB713|nr:DUF4267 domain-containing protein [Nocardioides sambongensis]